MTVRISRRGFLAMAGALGATSGIGLPAARAIEGLPDVNEALPRPGWVRSISRPKLAIDDAVYARFDKRRCVFFSGQGGSYGRYMGEEAERALQETFRDAGKRLASRPGYRFRERALAVAARTVSASHGGPNSPNRGLLSWAPLSATYLEEPLPADEWSDPGIATRDVKVAARFLGAALVGVCRLDHRHVYSHELDGKPIVFREVPRPFEDDTARVIPSSCNHVIVYAVRMSSETVKRAPTALTAATANLAYSQLAQVGASLAEFIRAMGYTAIPSINDTASTIPLAVEAGIGELGRHNRLITPEYGPMVRLGKILTDLPMKVDSPIDAGIMEFCRSCSKCAEACPAGALSFEAEPGFSTRGPWNNPGHEAWFDESVKCFTYLSGLSTNCMICFSVCPFSKKGQAAAHGLVKATVAQTDLFNGVLRSVDDAFGYGGQKSLDGWWELDLPPFGWD